MLLYCSMHCLSLFEMPENKTCKLMIALMNPWLPIKNNIYPLIWKCGFPLAEEWKKQKTFLECIKLKWNIIL